MVQTRSRSCPMCFQVNFVNIFFCMKLPTNNGRAVLTCDFYCFGVKAAPRLFDIFSSKNTAAFTPANTVDIQILYVYE